MAVLVMATVPILLIYPFLQKYFTKGSSPEPSSSRPSASNRGSHDMSTKRHSQPLTRRRALGLGAAAVTSIALSGCGDGVKPAAKVGHKPAKPPAYQPPGHAEDAITSTNTLVPNAFTSYPRPPFTSVSSTPAKGDSVTACLLDWGPPPPARDKNPWAQELDKRLGTRRAPTVIPAASYDTKVAAILASGDIPDVMWVQPDSQQPVAQAAQQGAFTNLSDILGGDGIKDYVAAASWHSTRRSAGTPAVRPPPHRRRRSASARATTRPWR